MNKIKLACFASVLAAGIAQAAPCDGVEVLIKNNLDSDVLVSQIHLDGATFNPAGIQKIDANSQSTFIVSDSKEESDLKGHFELHTINVPSKEINIKFKLENLGFICASSDQSPDSDYALESHRVENKLTYSISNK